MTDNHEAYSMALTDSFSAGVHLAEVGSQRLPASSDSNHHVGPQNSHKHDRASFADLRRAWSIPRWSCAKICRSSTWFSISSCQVAPCIYKNIIYNNIIYKNIALLSKYLKRFLKYAVLVMCTILYLTSSDILVSILQLLWNRIRITFKQVSVGSCRAMSVRQTAKV